MGSERLGRESSDKQVAVERTDSRPRSGSSRRPAPLPDPLRSGIESLSGIALDGVDVHYDSPEPSRIGALAYALGNSIHVAPGQERHLPHEAWHVVQQAQGRVSPSTKLMRGAWVNDDSALEREAEAMGAKASRIRPAAGTSAERLRPLQSRGPVIQRMKTTNGKDIATLAELNRLLTDLKSKVRLSVEDFDPEPTVAALDKAIAASSMVVEKTTTRNAIVSDLKTIIAREQAKKAKSPLELRKEAAKRCPTYPGGYIGGPANEFHVHEYGSEFHLKGPGPRKNIYVQGELRKDALKEARDQLRGHGLGPTLNAAIDKALIERGLALDNY